MNQLNIYHEIGVTFDPIYNQLAELNINDSILIDSIKITKNSKGWLELEREGDFHIRALDEDECYNIINSCLSPIL